LQSTLGLESPYIPADPRGDEPGTHDKERIACTTMRGRGRSQRRGHGTPSHRIEAGARTMPVQDDDESVSWLVHGAAGDAPAVLLHGSLDIWIHEARNLPNKDILSKRMRDLLCKPSEGMTSDPYVTVQVASAVVARTFVIPDDENPVWAQQFLVPVAHEAATVNFVVKDSDVVGAELIGVVAVRADQLQAGDMVEGAYPVLERNGKECAPGAVLRLSVQYVPVARLTMYHHGVTPGPDFAGVPRTYFPLRRGGKVTLYQDAHVPDGTLPEVRLGNGDCYRHGQCWRDVYDAICQARRLIYITGWSVFHTIHLVRDGHDDMALGDLLRRKSQEGVRVLLLVWDDPTSRRLLGIKMVHAVVPMLLYNTVCLLDSCL
jgi:phospholipase D1/2